MTQSRTLAGLLTAIGAAMAALALLVPAASATEPAAGFERFAGCPSVEENAEITTCMRTLVKSGHFKMGSKTVPISKPIALVGGTNSSLQNFDYNSKGGLEPVKQEVPGGVIGLTGLDWLVNVLSVEELKLYAVTELAGTPTVGASSLELPIKVHLINPALGNNCYVGSDANPIELNLTAGTTNPPPPNEPISGKGGTFEEGEPSGVIVLANGTFVDNAFAAPGAKGCSLLGVPLINIDALVNLQAGLPSPAGTNETVQNFDIELVAEELVYP